MLSTTVVSVPLGDADDAIAHVFGDKAVVVPDDADHRDIDVRENVGGRTLDRDNAHGQD